MGESGEHMEVQMEMELVCALKVPHFKRPVETLEESKRKQQGRLKKNHGFQDRVY